VGRFASEQGQHGLVTAVHTIEVADGQGAGVGQLGVVETAKNLHGMAGVVMSWTKGVSHLSLI
jgi:hypothetical protein